MNLSKDFNFFSGETIFKAFEDKYRVYLCGNLLEPQRGLECIADDKLEIGTSYYNEFTADMPHYHRLATEYNYVVKGKVKVFLFDSKEEYEFSENSLFVLQPNTKYAVKNAPDTQVFFIKCPGGNDKTLYSVDDHLESWLKSWD